MRIACLQFEPELGNVAHNIKRAEAILAKAAPVGLDLLILPELAFSGYNFKSLLDISFHLEATGAGPSTIWARSIARRLRCYVMIGYPELAAGSPRRTPKASLSRYNSAVIVSPEGNVLANYRKHFLYQTDEAWAEEGREGFYAGDVPGLGKIAMGICMDLNPYQFRTPFQKFEFANHVLSSSADLVVMPMAWLTNQPPSSLVTHALEPDADTLAYWIQRLQPVIDHGGAGDKEVIFVAANRTGSEDKAHYAGTSAVVGITKGYVRLYGCLGRGVEDLLVVDVPTPLSALFDMFGPSELF